MAPAPRAARLRSTAARAWPANGRPPTCSHGHDASEDVWFEHETPTTPAARARVATGDPSRMRSRRSC
eukprot:12820643-Alexandrium_andersonii.AAC.1